MKPTYLYIKQHNVSGKFYFGKTTFNPEVYHGSGVRWKRHLKKHGTFVTTLWYCLFTEEAELTKFALLCSEICDVVESDLWLNLKPENGLDGGATEEHLAKIQALARVSPKFNADPEHQRKFRAAAKHVGSKDLNNRVSCPHCDTTGNRLNMTRWHFDNCKRKTT